MLPLHPKQILSSNCKGGTMIITLSQPTRKTLNENINASAYDKHSSTATRTIATTAMTRRIKAKSPCTLGAGRHQQSRDQSQNTLLQNTSYVATSVFSN